MHVITLEKDIEQRDRVRSMLDMTGQDYVLTEADDIPALEAATPDWGRQRLAIIGAAHLDDALKWIVYLRGRMPGGAIVALREIQWHDATTQSRLHAAGADLVLDPRFSPSKMAMACERFIRHTEPPPARPVASGWHVRDAIRIVAPLAQVD